MNVSPKRRMIVPIILLFISGFGCLGVDRRGGVLRHQNQKAVTGFGSYPIGELPTPWKGPKMQLKQLVHINDELGATIVTDILCGPKFRDSPLPALAKDLTIALDRSQLGQGSYFPIAGREGFRQRASGNVDGVAIEMEAAVFKRNGCLYDMVYTAPPSSFKRGLSDFEEYLRGF